jgi:hypothetical protein
MENKHLKVVQVQYFGECGPASNALLTSLLPFGDFDLDFFHCIRFHGA